MKEDGEEGCTSTKIFYASLRKVIQANSTKPVRRPDRTETERRSSLLSLDDFPSATVRATSSAGKNSPQRGSCSPKKLSLQRPPMKRQLTKVPGQPARKAVGCHLPQKRALTPTPPPMIDKNMLCDTPPPASACTNAPLFKGGTAHPDALPPRVGSPTPKSTPMTKNKVNAVNAASPCAQQNSKASKSEIARGDAVVDVQTGRRGTVQSATRTHAKVVFEEATCAGLLLTDATKESTELVTIDSLQPAGTYDKFGQVVCPAKASKFAQPKDGPKAGCRTPTTLWAEPPPHRAAPSELEAFMTFLERGFDGSLVAAWMAMDPRGTGKVAFTDFVRAVRAKRYTANLQYIWKQLDPNDLGYITLDALDKDAAALIKRFTTFFQTKFNSLDDLYEKCLDQNDSGRVSLKEFMIACKNLGVFDPDASKSLGFEEGALTPAAAKRLFRYLDLNQSNDLTMDELGIFNLPRKRIELKSNKEILAQKKARDEEDKARALVGLKNYLRNMFGTVIVGWRTTFDPDMDGKLQFTEFCVGCKNIGFSGKLKTIWRALDKDGSGYVGVEEIDPKGALALKAFCEKVVEKYDTLEDAWEQCLDVEGSGKINCETFTNACTVLGYTYENPIKLYQYLDCNCGGWVEMLELDFLKLPRRKVEVLDNKEIVDARRDKEKQKAAQVLQEFKRFLIQRFGNLVVAWRRGLDPDGDGKLQFQEFCHSCRRLGFSGNLKALWISLDEDGSGYASLEELDPEASAHLREFKALLETFFETIDEAWYTCLDVDNSGRCTAEDFIDGCKSVGYNKHTRKLFQYCDLGGEGDITLDELDFLGLPRANSQQEAREFARESGYKARLSLERLLYVKYSGSLTRAWRLAYCSGPRTQHFSERLGSQQFAAACRKVGFRGNIRNLWGHLTSPNDDEKENRHLDRSYVNFKRFFPEGYEEINTFRMACESAFATASEVYFYLLERAEKGSVKRLDFIDAFRSLRVEGDIERIFFGLKVEGDQEAELHLTDLEDLHIGNKEAWEDESDGYRSEDDDDDDADASRPVNIENMALRTTLRYGLKTMTRDRKSVV